MGPNCCLEVITPVYNEAPTTELILEECLAQPSVRKSLQWITGRQMVPGNSLNGETNVIYGSRFASHLQVVISAWHLVCNRLQLCQFNNESRLTDRATC